MNIGWGEGGHLDMKNFNMNHVFNTPSILGDGTGIQQGWVGTGKLTQNNHGHAGGSQLKQ